MPRCRAVRLALFSALTGAALTGATLAGATLAGAPPAPAPGEAAVRDYDWQLPRGFPTPAVPADNPMSDAKVALGRRLFFEPRLSLTGRYSCASCHDPARSFSDGRSVARGATGAALSHNAMALVNVAYNVSFGWTTPEVRTLEAQMRKPLLSRHPIELGLAGRERALCAALAADPAYAAAFAQAFDEARGARPPGASGVTFDRIVKAIAAFERTLISGHSPFDRYVFEGEHDALSAQAKRGMALFFSPRVGCAGCHSGFNFAGNWRDRQGATGRPSFANNGASLGEMRVPTLRNVALTAPYMHDGRFATLDAVLRHYSGLAARVAATGGQIDPRLPQRALTDGERADLIAFLDSLTDEGFVRRFASAAAAP
ncbi:MAG TPA: cytochrome c peroxidase [Steroidobacteraceae bacterium]|nr:cytochrome c peroxidase [Steroidobacteraceae bacterium]